MKLWRVDGQQVEINLRTVFDDEGTPMSWGAIPPKLEKHVKKLVAKKIRWIKKAS